MLEDKLLIWKLQRGNSEALAVIYRKYKTDMLSLASALLRDPEQGRDIVHDVFVKFAENASRLSLRKSLRAYLLTSVANRVRSIKRLKWDRAVHLEEYDTIEEPQSGPVTQAVKKELNLKVSDALELLPVEQREIIILRLHGGLKFKDIAASLGITTNTAQSRYRYGIDKLRSQLDCEVNE